MIFTSRRKEWTRSWIVSRSCPIERNVHTYIELRAVDSEYWWRFVIISEWKGLQSRARPYSKPIEIELRDRSINGRRKFSLTRRSFQSADRQSPPSIVSSFNTFQPSFTNDQLSIWKNRRRTKKKKEKTRRRKRGKSFNVLIRCWLLNVLLEMY